MSSGYSHRTAAAKLGIKEGTLLALLGAPKNWSPEGLPEGVEIRSDLRRKADTTLAFMRSERELRGSAARLERALRDDAALWIAWPRKAAGHESDIAEQTLRDVFLPLGIVDVKVAAIDEDWSGLKFVRRKELRS